MARHKDINWNLAHRDAGNGHFYTDPEDRVIAVLMDIRDEMKQLNRVFACGNFLRIPHVLDSIKKNTTKKRKPKKLRMAT